MLTFRSKPYCSNRSLATPRPHLPRSRISLQEKPPKRSSISCRRITPSRLTVRIGALWTQPWMRQAAGHLVAFGITPTGPATGYGYVKRGRAVSDNTFTVDTFVEKPNQKTAKGMLSEGGYFWNSGMFVFRVATLIDELNAHAPEVGDAALKAVDACVREIDFIRLNAPAFSASPSISIDYAVYEKTDRAVVVPCQIQWSDLGNWRSIWQHNDHDTDGNLEIGPVTLADVKTPWWPAKDRTSSRII